MNTELTSLIDAIVPVSDALEPTLRAHLLDLTKPPGSLGQLETLAVRYGLIRQSTDLRPGRKIIFTFAADHGVADEGLSIAPKEVTRQMVFNMLQGGAAVNVLARHAGAENVVVDLGVDFDFGDIEGLRHCKIRSGTANIRTGPAMSVSEAEQAILIGAEMAREAAAEGVSMIGTGEMGIANTTPASALASALLGCPVDTITGRGTGIDDATLVRKISVIEEALVANKDRLGSPLEALAAVGGLEMAGICGLILGAASQQVPVVVDGFISTAGALAAIKLCPACKDYLFLAHRSKEKGHTPLLACFSCEPILDLSMRLGEGTGAALAMSVIDAALKVYMEMATFSGAEVSNITSGD